MMFAESFWGLEGFEDLRKYLKHGTELSRDIGSILQERAELELNYAKCLVKLGTKLSKATHVSVGTLANSWCLAGTEMESEAEVHRVFGQALLDDVCKLIKTLVDAQTKARKPHEAAVEKSVKAFLDRRSDEAKCKKNAFSITKEREKAIEQVSASRDGKTKNTSDKDLAKLEKKVTQLDESMSKADKEYFEASKKAETARQDWESQVYKTCSQFQSIEEEKIQQMQDMLNRYKSYLSTIGPKIVESCEKLNQAMSSIELNSDIRRISETKGKRPRQSEQILLDFYAEDRTNQMNFERRRQALQSYVSILDQELNRELKGREGVTKLLEVYKGQPSFGNSVTQEDGTHRLANVNATLRYLEASEAKISAILSELSNQPKPESQYLRQIERTRDKQGFAASILRMQSTVSEGFVETRSNSACYRPPAEGRIDSESEFDDVSPMPGIRCTAIYDFVGRDENELTIRPGDVITVYQKHDDGWWHGELNGRSGIFPGTYVE